MVLLPSRSDSFSELELWIEIASSDCELSNIVNSSDLIEHGGGLGDGVQRSMKMVGLH